MPAASGTEKVFVFLCEAIKRQAGWRKAFSWFRRKAKNKVTNVFGGTFLKSLDLG
jgi:hypothetical protein